MGIWDSLSELMEAAAPWSTAQAEAPAPAQDEEPKAEESKDDTEETEDEPAEETEDEPAEETEETEEKEEDAEDEEEEEEDEDEEEELEDPKDKFEAECKESKQCAPAKHHYDECVERVTKQQEENDGKADEDCVEEFFHLAHCATQCAAPKLWSVLK